MPMPKKGYWLLLGRKENFNKYNKLLKYCLPKL